MYSSKRTIGLTILQVNSVHQLYSRRTMERTSSK